MVRIEPTDTLAEAVAKINREIDRRRTYGLRSETSPTTHRMAILSWSNGAKRWFAGQPGRWPSCPGASQELQRLIEQEYECDSTCRPHDECSQIHERRWQRMEAERPDCRYLPRPRQCLDANEVLVVGLDLELLRALTDIPGLLADLPLYAGSTEARMRGEFRLTGIEVPPAIRNAPVERLDPKTVAALAQKLLEE